MKLPKKHSGSSTTIFTEMSALAQEYAAINLSQGFPDYEIDGNLKKYLAKATEDGFNQYAPMTGNYLLVEGLIRFNQQRSQPIIFSKSEITMTPGATYGIYTALACVLEPGDEVIILEPTYDSYQPAVEANGGIAVLVGLTNDFDVDWALLKSKISPKTKAIIVNTPHNPTGKIWEKNDWEKLWNLIENTEIIVVSDEVYDLIVYDGREFTSALHHPKISQRCFSIFSFGKMFHATGWKVGYVVANEEFTASFRHLHQYLSFSVNAPAQVALANYLAEFDVKKNIELLQQKRDFFLSKIEDLPFKLRQPTQGSYFQVLGFEEISDLSDKDFAIWLTKEVGVATVPMSAFYKDLRNTGKVRFCFTKKEETILAAIERLKKLK